MTSSTVHDTVLRMALACMAADPVSSLSATQRAWARALPRHAAALTPDERQRLLLCVVSWMEGEGCRPGMIEHLRGGMGNADSV